jgi:hypothetical protein
MTRFRVLIIVVAVVLAGACAPAPESQQSSPASGAVD